MAPPNPAGEEAGSRGQSKRQGVGSAEPSRDEASDHEADLAMEIRAMSHDVAEAYSPPRAIIEAKKFGLKAGEAMGLLTGWDFNKQEDRDRA